MTRPVSALIQINPSPTQAQQDLDRRCAMMPWSEFGLAERFITRYGHLFRYVEAWRKWLYFDGKRWVKTDLAAERLAKITINRLKHEALHFENPNDIDKNTES
jgi:phage/plasmid-associated DNA primase